MDRYTEEYCQKTTYNYCESYNYRAPYNYREPKNYKKKTTKSLLFCLIMAAVIISSEVLSVSGTGSVYAASKDKTDKTTEHKTTEHKTTKKKATKLRTKKEVLKWVKKQKGKKIDYDHHSGVQCVDLIKAYYNYLGVKPVSGDACTYTKNKLPKQWKRIRNTKKFVPEAGDIAVWKSGKGLRYGHVAIVVSANKKDMRCMNQHCDVVQCKIKTHKNYKKKKTFYGVIRPVFKE